MLRISEEVAIYPAHRFALAQPRGAVTGDTVVEYGQMMAYHPEWEPGFTEVWDVSYCPSVDIVPTDISAFKRLETETKELLQGSRTIIIASRPAVQFAAKYYARLMQAFGRDVVSATSQAEAAGLLGIDALPILSEGTEDGA